MISRMGIKMAEADAQLPKASVTARRLKEDI